MKIERFEDIEAWQLGRKLTKQVYVLTQNEPFSRDYGLRDQIQRASGSIMHNIAEGFDSGSNLEFVRFLGYAKRSCTEIQSQLYIAIDQGYVSAEEFNTMYEMAGTTRGKIAGFVKYLLEFEKNRKASRKPEKTVNREP